jgi:hypothetical protein
LRLRALALLSLPPLVHYLYHAFDGWSANWCQWLAMAGASVVLSLLVLERALTWDGWPGYAAVYSCLWMTAEGAQCVACGSMKWGDAQPGAWRMCRDELGAIPYTVVFCGAAACLIVKGAHWWTRRASGR